MISIKLNVLKIDKESLFKGEKGTYLDATLHDKPNEFSDGYITQSVSKEQREKGIKGEIIGNWKHVEFKAAPKHAASPAKAGEDSSGLPF